MYHIGCLPIAKGNERPGRPHMPNSERKPVPRAFLCRPSAGLALLGGRGGPNRKTESAREVGITRRDRSQPLDSDMRGGFGGGGSQSDTELAPAAPASRPPTHATDGENSRGMHSGLSIRCKAARSGLGRDGVGDAARGAGAGGRRALLHGRAHLHTCEAQLWAAPPPSLPLPLAAYDCRSSPEEEGLGGARALGEVSPRTVGCMQVLGRGGSARQQDSAGAAGALTATREVSAEEVQLWASHPLREASDWPQVQPSPTPRCLPRTLTQLTHTPWRPSLCRRARPSAAMRTRRRPWRRSSRQTSCPMTSSPVSPAAASRTEWMDGCLGC